MNEIAVRTAANQELEAAKEQVRMVVNTDFVPKHLRGNPHACLAAILFGKEVGLAPMESLTEVNIVDGRPALSAKAMTKLVRQRGHSITAVEVTDKIATVRGTRADNGDTHEVSFTEEMAKRAGLLGKSNWKSYPEDMLWARAVSRLCRRLFGDVTGALSYGPEEIEPRDAAVYEATADLPLVEPAAIPFEELREDKLRESTRDEPEPEDAEIEQAPLGSEFVRMAEEAQAKRMESGE